MNEALSSWDALIVGGGPSGLSAAIYLGRSQRKTLLVHSARSMAKWEKDVQNYLGFPDGIDGENLLTRGLRQARRYNVEIIEDYDTGPPTEWLPLRSPGRHAAIPRETGAPGHRPHALASRVAGRARVPRAEFILL